MDMKITRGGGFEAAAGPTRASPWRAPSTHITRWPDTEAGAVRCMAFEIPAYTGTAFHTCKGFGNCALAEIVIRFFSLAAVGAR